MSENNPRKLLPSNPGMFEGLSNRSKLILRLMADNRVNPLLKLIPITSLVYLLFPDLAPGPIDDALIIWLSTYLFVELCPPDVVQEHLKTINRIITGEWKPTENEPEVVEGEIIDTEFKEEK